MFDSLYLLFAAVPIIYEENRGWNTLVGSLPFLGVLVGTFVAAAVNIAYSHYRFAPLVEKHGRVDPEHRLPPMMIGTFSPYLRCHTALISAQVRSRSRSASFCSGGRRRRRSTGSPACSGWHSSACPSSSSSRPASTTSSTRTRNTRRAQSRQRRSCGPSSPRVSPWSHSRSSATLGSTGHVHCCESYFAFRH
jgi:hypothetical protein